MTVAIEADNFNLTTAARITGIVFYDVERADTFQGSVVWQIYSYGTGSSPGTLLVSGEALSVSHDATGTPDQFLIEYRNNFSIPPVSLAPGNYWLGLHNGPLSYSIYVYCYFERAGTQSVQPSNYYLLAAPAGWTTNSPPLADPDSELSFQLIGIPAAQITAVSKENGTPAITFTTTAGQYYRVEYKNALNDSSWTTIGGAEMIAGDGNAVSIYDPSAGPGSGVKRRYYHVLLL